MTGTQGATGTDEPTDKRRVIRLPRATRLLAAWLVCFAVWSPSRSSGSARLGSSVSHSRAAEWKT